MQVSAWIVSRNALPPPHIFIRGAIQSQIKAANHGRKRNIQLTPRQVDTKAHARAPTKRHQPLVEILLAAGQPALRLEGQSVGKDCLGLVHMQDSHADDGGGGDAAPRDGGAAGGHDARQRHARRNEAQRLLDGCRQQREGLEVLKAGVGVQVGPGDGELVPELFEERGPLQEVVMAHEQGVGDSVGAREDKREALVVHLGEVRGCLGLVSLGVQHAVEDGLVRRLVEPRGAGQHAVQLLMDDVADLIDTRGRFVGIGQ